MENVSTLFLISICLHNSVFRNIPNSRQVRHCQFISSPAGLYARIMAALCLADPPYESEQLSPISTCDLTIRDEWSISLTEQRGESALTT